MQEKEAHSETEAKTRTVHVDGTNMFRLVSIFGSLIAAVLSFLIIAMQPRACDDTSLESAVFICAGAHICTFMLLLANYICPKVLTMMGRFLSIFYVLLVGSMVSVQFIFF